MFFELFKNRPTDHDKRILNENRSTYNSGSDFNVTQETGFNYF